MGAVGLPADAPVKVGESEPATHFVIVNLDYTEPVTLTVSAPGRLQSFNPGSGRWSAARSGRLRLAAGGARLLRVGE